MRIEGLKHTEKQSNRIRMMFCIVLQVNKTKTKENYNVLDLMRISSIRITTLILCFVS